MHNQLKRDLALNRRAVREGWDYDRQKMSQELAAIVELRDPELTIEVAKIFLIADSVAIKEEEIELKREKIELEKRQYDDKLRLRLIELATSAGLIPNSGVEPIKANIASESRSES